MVSIFKASILLVCVSFFLALGTSTRASAAPSLFVVSPSSGPTQGNTPLTLSGTGFGAIQGSGGVTVGGLPCTVADPGDWSDTSVVCLTPAGEGSSLFVVLTTDAAESSNPGFFSYDPPSILSVTAPSAPTTGSTLLLPITVMISGNNFGITRTVTIGGSPCPVTSGPSHTELECELPEGQGLDQPVIVTAGLQDSNIVGFDYDPPLLTSLSPPSGDWFGGIELIIDGSNLGTSGSASVGGVDCPITFHDHDQIKCTLPQGFGNQNVEVEISGQTSNALVFAFPPPPVPSLASMMQLALAGLLLVCGINWFRVNA